ncbi:MAG: carbamoyl-phosphate synthase large subunit [Clostridiales bacterium]|nr:carbamoyl-phosphate synthase large subunit [Clostridiales bacterium]
MPKRADIRRVLVIGSGPIIIGQAAEFDYAGTQACVALREEGCEVVLVNSNPATIMTDTHMADAIYVEPLNARTLERIILKERPDSLLPTLGGQVGLNLAMELAESGFLERQGVRLLGCHPDSIKKAEDREAFREAMLALGEPIVPSGVVDNLGGALALAAEIGYPVVVRPAYTMGGTGGGFAADEAELREIAPAGLAASRVGQVLIERGIAGWKEIEFEVMRDESGCAIAVCSMENVDPVGIHTGDSIVVAPTQTLGRQEYDMLRRSALRIISALGINGGCNVQFALHPDSEEYALIEVNPRLSRSSALASKATGFPIARVASKLALGYRLDEIVNTVTGRTYASFEPAVDYVVLKFPRFPFDKFVYAQRRLGTQMKATGEVMAIAAGFEAALMKAVRSAEIGCDRLWMKALDGLPVEQLQARLDRCDDTRLFVLAELLRRGCTVEELCERTGIDRWFLDRLVNLLDVEQALAQGPLDAALYRRAKRMGFLDAVIERLSGQPVVRSRRASFKTVDTCAAEFEAKTPYFYSTWDEACEVEPLEGDKVLVFGSGPIRIGQGIEFDYCSVHCVWALRKYGYKAIIVNNNPETVSTDFDTADRLYFEPLTPEDVRSIVEAEGATKAVVQFGGQTAINLAGHLADMGVEILGTSADSIDAAEDRERFDALLTACGIPRPAGATVFTAEQAVRAAGELGYPVLVRPSYVLGGQGMAIAFTPAEVVEYMEIINRTHQEHPILVDKYLMGKEVEVDAICDGEQILIPGIMEHVERAGVHSGDSISVYPTRSIPARAKFKMVQYTERIAKALSVVGLVNIQFVLYNDEVYIIEVNPRSSRTVPYISKVTGVPMVELATRCVLGERLRDMGYGTGLYPEGSYYAVKVPVFSFEKLHDLDTQLGPEMKSTGEVLGIASEYRQALFKGVLAAGYRNRRGDCGVLLTVRDTDKQELIPIADRIASLGYELYATAGTARTLNQNMIAANAVNKIGEGKPDILDLLDSGRIGYVVSTDSKGRIPTLDSVKIRRKAVERAIPCFTAIDTADAFVSCLELDIGEDDLELIDITTL